MPAAFVLNLFALAIGLVICPVRLARAWARGRATQNLYTEDGVDHLLPRAVTDVRASLGLAAAPPNVTVRDVLAMTLLALPPLAVMLALVAAPFAGIWLAVNALL